MDKKDIKELLEDEYKEFGNIEEAFDSFIKGSIRELFEMDDWDVPKFREMIIPFQGINYEIKIQEEDLCEVSHSHRIMYWDWTVTPIGEIDETENSFNMENNIGFKVTVEFYCKDMIDEKTFQDEFNSDPMAAYKYISDNFNDDPINFSEDSSVIKVELL